MFGSCDVDYNIYASLETITINKPTLILLESTKDFLCLRISIIVQTKDNILLSAKSGEGWFLIETEASVLNVEVARNFTPTISSPGKIILKEDLMLVMVRRFVIAAM